MWERLVACLSVSMWPCMHACQQACKSAWQCSWHSCVVWRKRECIPDCTYIRTCIWACACESVHESECLWVCIRKHVNVYESECMLSVHKNTRQRSRECVHACECSSERVHVSMHEDTCECVHESMHVCAWECMWNTSLEWVHVRLHMNAYKSVHKSECIWACACDHVH